MDKAGPGCARIFTPPAMNQSNRRRLCVFLWHPCRDLGGKLELHMASPGGIPCLCPSGDYASRGSRKLGACCRPPRPESPRPFLTETQVLASRPVLELAAMRSSAQGRRFLSGRS